MTRNGSGGRPRPRISEPVPSASPDEAAAIAAALERFLAETAPTPRAEPPVSRWQSAALREGVERAPAASPWGASPS
jgi:hypothetical protein